jgi:hypothetical protein
MNSVAHFLLVVTLSASVFAESPAVSRGARIVPNEDADSGCTVHFLKADYKKPESTYLCGEWFAPEPGDHVVWLEGESRISPMWTIVMVPAPPAKNEMQMRMPMVDAASIAIDPQYFPDGGTARMVALSHDNVAFERRIMSREQAAKGVLMPAGTQFVATFGPDSRVLALAPIVNLKVGERYRFAPAVLGERGAILALLDQPYRGWQRDATVTLRSGGVALRPDALKVVQRRIYAVWYSVDPGDYTIDVAGMTLENAHVLVEKGSTATIRGRVETKSPE